jgi:DNA-directed RNA polymerase subunit H (RpoH/RPB5)
VIEGAHPTAKQALQTNKMPILSRGAMKDYILPIMEVFTVDFLTINPFKHALQPRSIRLITDEEEKEALRLILVQQIQNKNMTLAELLPKQRIESPIAIWYNAKIGDIVAYERSMAGAEAYYRMIHSLPSAQIWVKGKGKKKDEEDSEMDPEEK